MKKGSCGVLGMIAHVLVIIGALNWGLVGAFELDLVAKLLGAGSTPANVVYILVGLSALYLSVVMCMSKDKCCHGSCNSNKK